MKAATTFLDQLAATANDAAAMETAFRRESAERIKVLERDRSFAFRRLNLMRAIAEALAGADSEELAVASGLAVLRARLGWSSDSETRSAVLTRFAPVLQAVFASAPREPDAEPPTDDVLAALGVFEAWYAEAHGVGFWSLFEHPMPETPLVDF
jgi:hypothetical protein